MKCYTFKLTEPINGVCYVAVMGHSEADARLRAIDKGWNLEPSKGERALIDQFKKALTG